MSSRTRLRSRADRLGMMRLVAANASSLDAKSSGYQNLSMSSEVTFAFRWLATFLVARTAFTMCSGLNG